MTLVKCYFRGSTSSIAVNGGSKSSCLSSNVVDLHSGKQAFRLMVGPGHCLQIDFKIWPITFQGNGPSGPILFSCEKISL